MQVRNEIDTGTRCAWQKHSLKYQLVKLLKNKVCMFVTGRLVYGFACHCRSCDNTESITCFKEQIVYSRAIKVFVGDKWLEYITCLVMVLVAMTP